MYEFSLLGHSTDSVLFQLRMKDKDKKLSISEPESGLPKPNNKKRKSEATVSGKKPILKKPKPSSDDAPEFGVSKSHWANSELITADPNVIDLTGDDVGDEILGCLEEYEKATTTENNVIISYAAEEEHSGVHGLIDCLEYRSQAPSPFVPSTDHCEEAVKRIDCKEQHGVDKLVGETQSESGVGEVLSNLMHEIEEVEIGSLAGFLSIPDKEVGWLDHGPTLADIFPPTLADMGTNCVPKQPAIKQPI